MSFKPLVLSAPKQSSPKDGAVFSTYPRTPTLKWDYVEGAANYSVEVQYYDPVTSSGFPISVKPV